MWQPAVLPEGHWNAAHNGATGWVLPSSRKQGFGEACLNAVNINQATLPPPSQTFLPLSPHPSTWRTEKSQLDVKRGYLTMGKAKRENTLQLICVCKKKKSEPLENVLTCMVGSIHFPGQEKKKVPVVHRSGDSELNSGEISCKYPASVVSSSTRYAQWGSVHLLQEWNEEQIIVMSPFQMCGCRNPVGFP